MAADLVLHSTSHRLHHGNIRILRPILALRITDKLQGLRPLRPSGAPCSGLPRSYHLHVSEPDYRGFGCTRPLPDTTGEDVQVVHLRRRSLLLYTARGSGHGRHDQPQHPEDRRKSGGRRSGVPDPRLRAKHQCDGNLLSTLRVAGRIWFQAAQMEKIFDLTPDCQRLHRPPQYRTRNRARSRFRRLHCVARGFCVPLRCTVDALRGGSHAGSSFRLLSAIVAAKVGCGCRKEQHHHDRHQPHAGANTQGPSTKAVLLSERAGLNRESMRI